VREHSRETVGTPYRELTYNGAAVTGVLCGCTSGSEAGDSAVGVARSVGSAHRCDSPGFNVAPLQRTRCSGSTSRTLVRTELRLP
jgi:hypothetical protein